MEPFFSVLLSAIFLGDRPTLAVVAALLPIVGGELLPVGSRGTSEPLAFTHPILAVVAALLTITGGRPALMTQTKFQSILQQNHPGH